MISIIITTHDGIIKVVANRIVDIAVFYLLVVVGGLAEILRVFKVRRIARLRVTSFGAA